jgi:hypothetical protein
MNVHNKSFIDIPSVLSTQSVTLPLIVSESILSQTDPDTFPVCPGSIFAFLRSRYEQHPVHTSCEYLNLTAKSDKIFAGDYIPVYFTGSKYQ